MRRSQQITIKKQGYAQTASGPMKLLCGDMHGPANAQKDHRLSLRCGGLLDQTHAVRAGIAVFYAESVQISGRVRAGGVT
jgi:hypothetical protein